MTKFTASDGSDAGRYCIWDWTGCSRADPTFSLNAVSVNERDGFVIPSIADAYMASRWRISQGIAKIFNAANIVTSIQLEGRRSKTPEATFHSLRHTFVSLAANAGVPLHIVQSIVGHESTAMTRHYYHENVDSLRMAVNTIPVLN